MEFQKDLSHVEWEEVKRRQLQRIPLVYEWIKLVGMKQGLSVLDIGTGPGVFTKEYASVVQDKGIIYALDKSNEALEFLLKEINKHKIGNIQIIRGDAEISMDHIGKADIVMITDILHHTDSPFDIIRNVYKHIDEDGCVLIAEFDPDSEGHIGPPLKNRLPKEEIKKLVQTIGFQVVREGNQEFEHYYLLIQK